MSELKYVKEQLAKRSRAEWLACSKKTKVPFRTISRIAYGETPSPRSDTTASIAEYFQRIEQKAA